MMNTTYQPRFQAEISFGTQGFVGSTFLWTGAHALSGPKMASQREHAFAFCCSGTLQLGQTNTGSA